MPAGAVLLKDQNRQEVKGTVYHVEQKSEIEWQINCEKEGGMEGLMLFSMMEQFPMDFLAPSFYCCKHPNSNFRARRIVNRCLPDGHIGLQNQLLTIRKGEETQQIELDTPEAVQEALRKYFGIVFS